MVVKSLYHRQSLGIAAALAAVVAADAVAAFGLDSLLAELGADVVAVAELEVAG